MKDAVAVADRYGTLASSAGYMLARARSVELASCGTEARAKRMACDYGGERAAGRIYSGDAQQLQDPRRRSCLFCCVLLGYTEAELSFFFIYF